MASIKLRGSEAWEVESLIKTFISDPSTPPKWIPGLKSFKEKLRKVTGLPSESTPTRNYTITLAEAEAIVGILRSLRSATGEGGEPVDPRRADLLHRFREISKMPHVVDHIQKEPWQMTRDEVKNWDFNVQEGGGSKTPKSVFSWGKADYETLYDLSQNPDTFRYNEVLGKGYEDWKPSLYLKPAIKNNELIKIYRVSEYGDIIPGAYVSESLEYVRGHQKNIMQGAGKIYSRMVKPSELMIYGDPHEFIYIPESVESYHRAEIAQALAKGKPVPPEVLADYPDLAKMHTYHSHVIPEKKHIKEDQETLDEGETRKIVEAGGGTFVGFQDRSFMGKSPLLLVNDSEGKTKSTIAIDLEKEVLTPEVVRSRIEEKRQEEKPYKFLYHGTTQGALRKIASEGLLPTSMGQVSLSKTEQYAKSYADRKGGSRGIVLRVRDIGKFEKDTRIPTGGDYLTREKIPPEDIEVKMPDGTWVFLPTVDVSIGVPEIRSGCILHLPEKHLTTGT